MSVRYTVDGPPAGAPHADHMLPRTVILPELRGLFLPVAQAAFTTGVLVVLGLAWFPEEPSRAADIVRAFRRFVAAVGAGEASDVHWAVQKGLVEQLPLNHVGHIEQIDETLELLRRHVGEERWPQTWGDHNRSSL